MNFDFLSSLGSNHIISTLETFLSESSSILPASFGISSTIQIGLVVVILSLGLGILFRIFFGKNCNANQAISASLGILFIYSVTIAVYTLNPLDFSKYLSPLPFAIFRRDILIILPFIGTEKTLVCSQILSLIILCFIVHFLDFILPTGKSFFMWLLLRCISIGLAIFLNLAANLALNTFLPEGLANIAPAVLLVVLIAALVVGLFNGVLCIIFTIVNPIVGLLYTFFFSTTIGKQLTKAVLSSTILCLLFFAMEYLGYSVINIEASALLGYLPICGLILAFWYFFDSKL